MKLRNSTSLSTEAELDGTFNHGVIDDLEEALNDFGFIEARIMAHVIDDVAMGDFLHRHAYTTNQIDPLAARQAYDLDLKAREVSPTGRLLK